ncbi:MoaD/ThiS family protein [Reichenbachiella versicolor]|uniref:MoaD/ThiS family protein n=1 Tax=Reichenbachiella versicolor TaxID=1821036 RepID=UPI000D6DF354|nr:MoaD/ThiS family protein [Reichenbachiella versicolor]
MEVTIVAYGIARDIIGTSELILKVDEGITVKDMLTLVKRKFPDFEKLTSLLLAVNEEYVEENHIVESGDELVLIPPVSGG